MPDTKDGINFMFLKHRHQFNIGDYRLPSRTCQRGIVHSVSFPFTQDPPTQPDQEPFRPRGSLGADGAQREGRTPTLLREPDFESGASASSAIRARPQWFERASLHSTKASAGQSAPLFPYPDHSVTIHHSHSPNQLSEGPHYRGRPPVRHMWTSR